MPIIYEYERVVGDFIKRCFPVIDQVVYAKDEDLFNAIVSIRKYPCCYYTRSIENWEDNRPFSVADGSERVTIIPFKAKYTGYIYVENTELLHNMANKLKFYWMKNHAVRVKWLFGQDLPIQLRLLYINLDELRRPDDKKGACRVLSFSWQSNLFWDVTENENCVEQVNLKVNQSMINL